MDFGAGRTLEYGVDDLSNVDLAYATTIHKAMGSEYETVIMPLLKAHTIMMYRNLLYTGITRAKKRVVLIGQKQVLFMAIHRNEIGKRIRCWVCVFRCISKPTQRKPVSPFRLRWKNN